MAAYDNRWQSTRDSVNDIAGRFNLPPVFWEPPLDYRQNDNAVPFDVPSPAEDYPRTRYLYILSFIFSVVLHVVALGYATMYIFLREPEAGASVESTASISVELVDSDVQQATHQERSQDVALAPAPSNLSENYDKPVAPKPEEQAQQEPKTPDTPDMPKNPESPYAPHAPHEPDAPDTPDEPDAPNAPPEQTDIKATPPNSADDKGKEAKPKPEPEPTKVAPAETQAEAEEKPAVAEAQPLPASSQQADEPSSSQQVAALDLVPPIPVAHPHRDVQQSETAKRSDQVNTKSAQMAGSVQHSNSYSSTRRASASLRQVLAYRKKVREQLAANKPNGGRGRGTVRVTFVLTSTGRVVAARVTRSSGKRVLDQAALGAVYDASPFPLPPQGIRASRLRFTFPFYFR